MQQAEQQRVFDDWLRGHKDLVFKIVRAYAFDRHDQEDLFQEVAYQLWQSIPGFKRESSVTTWIYRVALYCGIAWSKRERRQRDRKQALESVELPALLEPVEQDPRVDWLYAQIARLAPVDRSLVLLLLDGLSYREMAATLGISESHVGVKLTRIKQALAQKSKVGAADGPR